MKTLHLIVTVTIAIGLPESLVAQTRPLGICQALNSAANHQLVTIHGRVVLSHGDYLVEGTGRDPCPGWRTRLFTAPASIPLVIESYNGVRVPEGLIRNYVDFMVRLRSLQKANPSAQHMVTISGVLIRKALPLSFRGSGGSYAGWGEGAEGGFAAELVVTSLPVEDR